MFAKINSQNYLFVVFLIVYAFLINWFSAQTGILPIDSFAFFDSAFSILNNNLPIRDFWIFTGLLLDYIQALFFFIFGASWSSYIAHASLINILASLSLYFFLNKLNLKKFYSFLYSISFATLFYPLSGSPFAYLHAYAFSLISIFLLCLCIYQKNNFLWFLIPIISLLAFLSMQTPTMYILFILLFFSFYFFIAEKNKIGLKNFIFGTLTALFLIIFFLFVTKTPFQNFLYQYFLFPLTIGEGRIASDSTAYVRLIDQLNFQRLFGNFKFIHFFLIPLIILTVKMFFNKERNKIYHINLIIILSCLCFVFNQLVTANQIFIFSLIPLLAGILHINLSKFKYSKYFVYLILLVVFISTTKFHYRYNIDRKFLDLEEVDKSRAIESIIINEKLKNLKWITKFKKPKDEIELINKAINLIKKDNRQKLIITHYQFFSSIIDNNLTILNRWYLWDNNTHPTETHKYFNFYKEMVDKIVKKNNIEVIYLLGSDIEFNRIKNYFSGTCFTSLTVINNEFSYHEIINCKT